MNFSRAQWAFSLVLDLLVKTALLTFVGLLITLSAAPVGGFVALGAFFSILHFLCLFMGFKAVSSLEFARLRLNGAIRFWLAVIVANVLFAAAATMFFSSLRRSDDVGPSIQGDLTMSGILVVTNLIPILVVAALGCLLGLVMRGRHRQRMSSP
ncbi:hypothetical protein [Bradyrhizobium sp.]|uniref:hypothetical protein n=1 Tax=Bradyrhizobium sp. TaxID=376 RepID=UPI001EC930C0|nr:hypothetical protein [Bradyrhizobium sp.]MBV9984646.1 hypothetical protein [Bradyrhizobium sp.]